MVVGTAEDKGDVLVVISSAAHDFSSFLLTVLAIIILSLVLSSKFPSYRQHPFFDLPSIHCKIYMAFLSHVAILSELTVAIHASHAASQTGFCVWEPPFTHSSSRKDRSHGFLSYD